MNIDTKGKSTVINNNVMLKQHGWEEIMHNHYSIGWRPPKYMGKSMKILAFKDALIAQSRFK
ncbi:hypothetical protein KAR28_03020 [Candidatus Parcubacteria bacterium]|nr:hypothetical protein [Candidatus Parcubacteria bacterium]